MDNPWQIEQVARAARETDEFRTRESFSKRKYEPLLNKYNKLLKKYKALKEFADDRQSELRKEIKRLNDVIFDMDDTIRDLRNRVNAYESMFWKKWRPNQFSNWWIVTPC